MRVYKKDGAGNAHFIGKDNIDHTPKNEKARLKLGDACDVPAEGKTRSDLSCAGALLINQRQRLTEPVAHTRPSGHAVPVNIAPCNTAPVNRAPARLA